MILPRAAALLLAALAAGAIAAGPASAVPLPAGSTAILSGQPSLVEAFPAPVGEADVSRTAVSRDGRFVAFTSSSDGLVDGDDDRVYNVYRKDLETGEVVLVSRRDGAAGEPSHGYCGGAAISDDATRVAFVCNEPLDGADQNRFRDVYVRTISSGTTTLVSRVSPSGPAGDDESADPVLSENGDYVAYFSSADNLIPGVTVPDNVYRTHLPTLTTVAVGRRNGLDGAQTGGIDPSITNDGNLVAFATKDAADPADTVPAEYDVYVRNVQAGTTTYASRKSDTGGTPGAGGNSHSYRPAISGNGVAVVFESRAANLDARDTDSNFNIYKRTLGAGITTLVDVTAGGAKAAQSHEPSVDSSGQVVAFVSEATNLDPADTNPSRDVYVKHTGTESIELATRQGANGPALNHGARTAAMANGSLHVAAALDRGGNTPDADAHRQAAILRDLDADVTRNVARPAGGEAFVNEGGNATGTSLSADGRFAAFRTGAPGLGLPADRDGAVVVRDRTTGDVTLASRQDGPDGGLFVVVSDETSISADGRRVAFSAATEPAGTLQVYVRDLAAQRTFLASRADGGAGAAGDGDSTAASLDADGTRVAFRSRAANLADGDQDDDRDIHVRDLETGATILVSRANGPAGEPGNAGSYSPAIDASGNRVAFASDAKNLGDGDDDFVRNIHVRDIAAGTTRLVDATAAGTKGDADADDWTSIDAAGERVAFSSVATNLGETSNENKAFVKDLASGALTVLAEGYNPVISPDGGFVAHETRDDGVIRRDLATGQSEVVARRPDGSPVLDADVRDITVQGACVAFETDEAIVGAPSDSWESYLRVFADDCGDPKPVPGDGAGAGDGPVIAGGPDAAPLDRIAPVLSKVRLERRRFRRSRGTKLRFVSSEGGTLRVTVQRIVRRRGGRRVPRRVGTLTRQIAAGPGRVTLRGRVGRRALRRGRHRLRVVAVDAAGNRSVPRTRRFRVVGG
jgi:Tol biopolymer transport system component